MSGEELISQLDHESIVDLSIDQIIHATQSSAACIFLEKEGDLNVVNSYGLKMLTL